jgi:hypothetical protein
MKEKYDPILKNPLHNPGDSLYQELFGIFTEGILKWIVFLICIGSLMIQEWILWFMHSPPNPALSTILFFVALPFCAYKIWVSIRKSNNYKLGLKGERYMGEILNDVLPELGYHTIHDIFVGRMNIDHVLIGPAGIFTIETKSARKTRGENHPITHTEKGLMINNKPFGWGKKAIWEAEKEASYLKAILTKDDNQCPHIQPIVVYPTWDVIDDCKQNVWVLNENYLIEKIKLLPTTLNKEKIDILRRKIEEYVRN